MTTATDDIGPRLAAVEAHIVNINTQLAEINANQRQLREEIRAQNQSMREEFQTQNRSMREEFQTHIRDINARIDRLQYTIIGFGATLIITMLGMIITLILKL